MSMPRLSLLSGLILLAIFLLTPTLSINPAKALDQAIMFVDPASIVNPTLTPSNNFIITVNVSDVTNLFTWQAKLWFDPSILECTDAYYPPGHVFDGSTNIPIEPIIDNISGYVLHGCTLLLDSVDVNQGVLCAFDFHVLDTGSCDFTLDQGNSFLLDFDLEDIPTTLVDGFFDNREVAVAQMFVDPETVISPELGPSSQFTITANVSEVTNLFTWQIGLWFDPSILECTDAYYPPGHVFDGLTNIPVEPEIDNVAGSVLYGCSLLMDSVDVPEGVLCALDFHVLNRGSCALALDQDDSFLLDYDLNVIPTTLRDGFFDNRVEEVHDVAITGVVPSSTSVTVGDSMLIDVTVENEGNFEETFDVTAYYNGNAINATTGVYLNAGKTDVLPFTWDTTGVALGTYTISASATVVAGEEDKSDNFLEDGTVKVVEALPPPGSALWIEPSIVELPKAMIGDRFDLTLWINLTEVSFAWQVKVLYPSNYFNAIQVYYTAAETSNFFSGHSTVPFTPIIDNMEGYVLHGESLLGADSREPGTGSLVLIEFELHQIPPEIVNINFSTPYGEDTFILNPDLEDIPIEDILGTEVHALLPAEVHDVAVVDVVPSTRSVFAGQPVVIDVTVENQGDFAETFDVAAYYGGIMIDEVTTTLDIGEIDVVALFWDTAEVSTGTYAISAEASVLLGEMDVADNFLQNGIVQVLEPPPYIPIAVNIHPETLNLKSKGRWITCVIELPEGYSARDIDISTIMLNNIIPVAKSRCRLMVKFDRAEVISYICEAQGIKFGDVLLKVTGELYSGVGFEGSDTVRVRMPGDVDCNGKVNVRDVALIARRFGQHQYNLEWDLNEDEKTDFRDIVIAVVNFGKTF